MTNHNNLKSYSQLTKPDSAVRHIHLIFKTHLDVGFTDLANQIEESYFSRLIPKALDLSETLRNRGGPERFTWTTGSWLITEALERAKGSYRRRLEAAISHGDILWHALPFTMHCELMDRSLFEFGLSLSQKLDEKFGKQTIAGKMTDVPGHTRGIVPLLSQANIQFLHIGVNPASRPPATPPVFVWRDPASQKEIVVAYHRKYGDTTTWKDSDHALAICFTGDNKGPQSMDDVLRIYEQRRTRFKNAEIKASSLDNFARELVKHKSSIPVIDQELGDMWIHGLGTDPIKVAKFRELCRLRNEWLKKNALSRRAMQQFSRKLLMIPEHTWGLDEKENLADYATYRNDDFKKARRRKVWKRFESSWNEQREYLTQALETLPQTKRKEAETRLATTVAKKSTGHWQEITANSTSHWNPWTIRVDSRTGAIIQLRHDGGRHTLAGRRHPLGTLQYEVFSEVEYQRFIDRYLHRHPDWAVKDFTKPGMKKGNRKHQRWMPEQSQCEFRETEQNWQLRVSSKFDPQPIQKFGCPGQFITVWTFDKYAPNIDIEVQWFDKQACRVAEAVWWSFQPNVAHRNGWRINKLGSWIDPLNVIRDGNKKLHGTSAVSYKDDQHHLLVETVDAPLVAPGRPALLEFDNRQPPMRQGIHFNLYNNQWGTNFPMWFGENAKFRFRIHI